ncbi:MAG: hypothetical protein HC800_21490 [Phormidesmis sp. RL_2_1]|nr:hypothetical protein [Phormidesmis sp. RL_2_1]
MPTDTAALRRLIYQATYGLSRQKRTHAAQLGALLRKQDRTFSYEKYSFTKLIDLLEAVPDLVEMERIDPDSSNPNSAPVYYVRPVTDTKRLLTDALTDYDSPDGWVHIDSLMQAICQKAACLTQIWYFRLSAMAIAILKPFRNVDRS